MNKMIMKVRNMILPYLGQGEKIQSIGFFRRGAPGLSIMTVEGYFITFFYLGVTNKRLFIIRTNEFGMLIGKKSYSVPLSHIEMIGKEVYVTKDDGERIRYIRTGIPQLHGVNIKEFEDAIKKFKKSTFKPPRTPERIKCPNCSEMIWEDAERCPFCEKQIIKPQKKSK